MYFNVAIPALTPLLMPVLTSCLLEPLPRLPLSILPLGLFCLFTPSWSSTPVLPVLYSLLLDRPHLPTHQLHCINTGPFFPSQWPDCLVPVYFLHVSHVIDSCWRFRHMLNQTAQVGFLSPDFLPVTTVYSGSFLLIRSSTSAHPWNRPLFCSC